MILVAPIALAACGETRPAAPDIEVLEFAGLGPNARISRDGAAITTQLRPRRVGGVAGLAIGLQLRGSPTPRIVAVRVPDRCLPLSSAPTTDPRGLYPPTRIALRGRWRDDPQCPPRAGSTIVRTLLVQVAGEDEMRQFQTAGPVELIPPPRR